MDYVRKNSDDNIQNSELVKINQNTILYSLNNKTFVNNSLFNDSFKIHVNSSLNQNLNNTLFYNHNDDDNKINSTIRTQCIIFIPLISIIILILFFIFNHYLILLDNKRKEEDIYNERCISCLILFFIFLCYFLSIKTSSKQIKIEKYIYKNIINNNEIKANNTENNNGNINNDENIYINQIKVFNNKDGKSSQNIIYFDYKNYNQVCNYCHIRTFLRATHCLVCDECILFKQEHCQYIANCIGFNNIQYFINFLSWSIFGLIFYSFYCIKFFKIFELDKISLTTLCLIISNFAIYLMILIMLILKLCKLFKNILRNITQYELQMEDNEKNTFSMNSISYKNKEHNLFNIGILNHLYYIIGPTPFHFIFPLPNIKVYGNDENCPVFLKCKLPNRLELIKYLAKKDPKYKKLLDDVESDPNNYIKLCHDYYDDKLIK
jgi:hypothetical protein